MLQFTQFKIIIANEMKIDDGVHRAEGGTEQYEKNNVVTNRMNE